MANRVETSAGFERSTTDSVDWLRAGALAGLCLDGVTTGYVLVTDSYRELNPVLADLWTIHPAVVAAYFLCFICVVWIVTHRRGWLSTAISAAVLFVMGGFGGLNNLALFAFGPPSLLEWLATGLDLPVLHVIMALIPACGLAVGLVVARLRHGRLPWREVAAVVGGGGVGYLVYLWAAHLLGGALAVVL